MFRFPGKINTIKYKPFFPPYSWSEKHATKEEGGNDDTVTSLYFICSCVQWGHGAAASAGENRNTVERCWLWKHTTDLFFSLLQPVVTKTAGNTFNSRTRNKREAIKGHFHFSCTGTIKSIFSSFIHGIIQCTSPFNTHLWRLYRFITHDNTHIHVSKRWTSCRNFKQYHFSLSFPVLKYLEMLFFWIWRHEW